MALLGLQKLLFTTSSLCVRVRFHRNAEHLWKREGRGEGKAKGGRGGSPPWLSTLQRIWTAEKKNHVSKCQTNAIPAKPHLILLNQQKNYPLPDFSYLTNKGLGFFPLLGQSPCCKILALISGFNNMCCTSAQKRKQLIKIKHRRRIKGLSPKLKGTTSA